MSFSMPPPPLPAPPDAATSGSLVEPLWVWAQWSLQNQLHDNATFLAERVCAESSCDASKLLLATCHYAAGAANRAAVVLQGCSAPQNRYLLALCCMRLGRLPEAQTALLGASMPDTDASAALPNGAAGLYLMGTICLKMQQRQRAIKYLTRSLSLNPFMWSAYEALSQLGAPLPDGLVAPPMPFFGGDGVMPVPATAPDAAAAIAAAAPPGSAAPSSAAAPGSAAPATPMVTPGMRTPAQPSFTPSIASSGAGGVPASASLGGPCSSVAPPGSLSTPNCQTPAAAGGAPLSAAPPSPGGVGGRRIGGRAPPSGASAVSTADDASRLPAAAGVAAGRRGRALGGSSSGVPVRRSSRLSSTGPDSAAAQAAAISRGEMPPPALPRAPGGGGGDGAAAALWLLRQLADGYRALCQYRCYDAVNAFKALPSRQYNTGWVLNQVGRAHFEMVQYADALRAFEQAQQIEPHRLCGMEVHSDAPS